MNFIINPDYKKFYSIYKKLPGIVSIILAVLVFAWSIVDVSVFSYSGYYSSYYGVMQIESLFLALIIWWAIGAVLCAATWFFSALFVSATVARTDATIEINKKLAEND